jgi:hypothetical protein
MPSFGGKHDMGGRCAGRKSNTCKADVHVGKAEHARQKCMQKRKSYDACMQEYLAMIGLDFW